MNCGLALSYDAKDFSLAGKGVVAKVGDGWAFTNPSAMGLYKVNGSTSVAFEVTNDNFAGGVKGLKQAWNTVVAKEKDAGLKMKLSGSYALDSANTLKFRVDEKQTVDFAINSKLGGGASLQLSNQYKSGEAATYGVQYTLEA